MNFRTFVFLMLVSVAACKSQPEETATPPSSLAKKTWTPPPAGLVVDEYAERITEDDLNDLSFKIILMSTAESEKGIYGLHLQYGHNRNETQIVLPKWSGNVVLKPVIRKGDEKYECLIGFEAGDGIFHELYKVNIDHQDIKMKQTKAYYLEQSDN